MATPRKRWFKTADALLREPLTRRGRSTYLGLAAWMNQRRSRDGLTGRRAVEASIPPGDLLTITLSDSLEEARDCIAEISERFEIVMEARERFTFVRWRNLAEFQEWERPESGQRSGSARAADSPAIARPMPSPAPAPAPISEPREEVRRSPSEIEPAAPSRPPWLRLLNLLSEEPGSIEDKRQYLAAEWAVLDAEAAKEASAGLVTKSAAIKAITIRYYRAHLRRGSGGAHGDALSRKVAELDARRGSA